MMGKKQLEGFLKTFSNDKSKEIILCDPKNQNQIVSELNKKQQELVNDVKSGYFIDVVLVENWEIEKGLVEDPIIGKNGQYYFTLGDNFDSSDISLFISDAKENVMEKISYEILNDRHQHIEIYRNIRSNEFIGIVKNILSNKFSLGIAGRGDKSESL
ncbi:hypothetical protein SAMN04487887_11517 [Enterococcus casseliflavus]|uniref:hypothetical protein n=1 Tax=Enterococcus casseliflavus TaxID=37734 RepID=UPI0008EAFE86|nr:hypothetical protein [Enterococcus casseliflavus]SFE52959.1 hypothetical protein SAMN04487887_11517 [Enterococcus casseliflavus]